MNNLPKVLITGNSSGLGLGLTQLLLEKDWQVFGCSRRGCAYQSDYLNDIQCDLAHFDRIPVALTQLLSDVQKLNLVVLNAGMLGQIRNLSETPMSDLQRIMDLNVWSNKVIFDWLLHSGIEVNQIVLISSAASVLGNKGWSGYAMSKAALNMLAKLYAHEFPDTHIAAIAPGIIETQMMDYLCEKADSDQFPALKRLQQARGTETMLTPKQAAERIIKTLPDLKSFTTGSYVDLRQILAPEEYKALMSNWNKAD